jgi:dephospho-CoA kinase
MARDQAPAQLHSPRVVVVGPCASGKTTLVRLLRERGVDAYVCSQEHSIVRDLWRRQHPDVVVALEVDLETIRARRGDDWSAAIYEEQRRRLEGARNAADLIIDTAHVTPEEAAGRVLALLRSRGMAHRPADDSVCSVSE